MTEAGAQFSKSAPYVKALVALVLLLLLVVAAALLPQDVVRALTDWLDAARQHPWAPAVAIAAYMVFASVATPQIVIVTAVVAVFGPWMGLLYCWCGNLLSSSIGFLVGRRFGAKLVARHASPQLNVLMQRLARRGFIASALIRLVPTIPSVMVNIAAGATPIRYRDFIAGTAIGSVPKMALFAFGGSAAIAAIKEESWWAWAGVGLAVLIFLVLGWFGRRWLKTRAVKPDPTPLG